MKTTLRTAAAAVMLATCCASDGVHRVKIVKIRSEIQQTPEFQVNGVNAKDFGRKHWLEIEAELEVETKAKSGYIPEITARWHVVVYDNILDDKKQKKEPVRLLGDVRFMNIRAKDKRIFISAYVDPYTLEQLTGESKPSERDIESIALVIKGTGVTTQGNHAKGLFKATTKQETGWWTQWKGRSQKNAILAKSKTPFATLWTDRYPTEVAER
jgi:hypothetical protein